MEGRATVAVVPGAAVWPGDVASPALERRVQAAIDLVYAGAASHLLVSGAAARGLRSEASVGVRLALGAGLSGEQAWKEERATNTRENALFAAALLRERLGVHVPSVLVVTDSYHVPRAVRWFRHFGCDARGVAVATPASVWLKQAPREVGGLLRQALSSYFLPLPLSLSSVSSSSGRSVG